jgi:hypothetical protein
VKRYRNRAGGTVEDLRTMALHQRAKRPRERPPGVIFERVDNRSQRAFIGADGARAIHEA